MSKKLLQEDKVNYFGTDKCHMRYCDSLIPIDDKKKKIDVTYFGVSFPCDLTKFFPLLTVKNANKSSNVLKLNYLVKIRSLGST